jgi:hypothetical protein
MSSTRRLAVAAGVFFLITEVTSLAALVLYHPVLHDSRYILGSGANGHVLLGGFLEVILAIANIGTGVALYPIVKRHNPALALGYVVGRLLEAAVIVVGIISVLSIVTLRQHATGPGTDTASLVTVGKSLVAIHDWTFLLGPGLIIGVNSLMLAYVMHRSRLVPRSIAMLGLVGGPLVFASSTAVLFGVYPQASTWGFVAALPVFAWEVSLATYLIVKGVKPVAVTSRTVPLVGQHADLVAA